ncbi:hypothetical protein PHYPSEUDO_006376 [Phytophthora pseudosyringae]|uniref:Uncharacterized protein n=1 Tax=Phytophthora pseudosyringae TaxID=221518 RepID=A0A8T1WA63_9STRA|nr:hypothetical protein PHYPSEUDO_006376 [Phytophthora pseudosyringae]
MEAITNQLAQFSLGEVQRPGVSSSYALLMRKVLAMTLEMRTFPCLVLERPDAMNNEFTQRRVSRDVTQFSAKGKRCLVRLKEQWALRFRGLDESEIKAMLLDPRIKSKASEIIDDAAVLARVGHEIPQEHATIFKLIATSTAAKDTPNHVSFSGSDLFHVDSDASSAIGGC